MIQIRRLIASIYGAASFAMLASLPLQAAETAPNDSLAAQQKQLEAARQRLSEAAHEVAELSGAMMKRHMPDTIRFLGYNPNRAILGIGLGAADERQRDNGVTVMGVTVMSVSPGGAAANAGIEPGDVITEINGKSLRRDGDRAPRDKLLDEVAKLSPGDKAVLSYERDGKSDKATLTAQPLPEFAHFERFRDYRPGGPDLPVLPDLSSLRSLKALAHRPFGAMELAPITPKLGQYFGTEKGLLVVRAPEDARFKLEDGDVLIDIDGRVPQNSGHAFSILSSYRPGEKFTLNILRQRKKMALSVELPQPEPAHPARRVRENPPLQPA